MTERDYGADRDYPDGSVGRYVRERWGAPARAPRPYIAPVPAPPEPAAPEPDPYADPYADEMDAQLELELPEQDRLDGERPTDPLDRSAPPAPEPARAVQDARADLRSPRAPMSPVPGPADYDGDRGAHHDAERDGQYVGEYVDPDAATPPSAAAPAARIDTTSVEPTWTEPVPAGPPPAPPASTAPPAPPRAPRGSPARDPLPEVPTSSGRRTSRAPGELFGGGEGGGAPAATPPRGARWTDPGAIAAQEAQRARSGGAIGGAIGGGVVDEPADPDLSSARLLRTTKRPPRSGWRRLVYVLSGRLINPGESPADVHRRELTARVNQPLLGCYKIAMLSLKGGVGKTTVTATLGSTFASLRGDRVVAVDANPDRGTLSQKIPLETSATVRHLLRDAQRVRRYTDVRAYTSQGPSRLEVLASEQDPAVSEAFSEDDYRRTVTLLEHFYNIVLTDCGTGLMHSAMYGVLGVADQLIIVSSGSIDGARSASATMDWLDAHGHGDLVRNSVAVINCVHRSSGGVDLDRVAEHFSARCRAVVRIPFDAHLEEGAEVDLDRLEPATRLALLELAATVADVFEGIPA
jgi:MinD-like ATPase involved in chromosome partitioning or flagellar assembly